MDAIRAKTGLVIDAYFSGTKVRWLLENVPGNEQALYFEGTRFSRNGTDIDNWCGHETDISQAIFE